MQLDSAQMCKHSRHSFCLHKHPTQVARNFIENEWGHGAAGILCTMFQVSSLKLPSRQLQLKAEVVATEISSSDWVWCPRVVVMFRYTHF